MRCYLVLGCILFYTILGLYDLVTGRYRAGAAEVLLAAVNAILFL